MFYTYIRSYTRYIILSFSYIFILYISICFINVHLDNSMSILIAHNSIRGKREMSDVSSVLLNRFKIIIFIFLTTTVYIYVNTTQYYIYNRERVNYGISS